MPILPGVMPVMAYAGFKRMTGFCKTAVPQHIADTLEAIKGSEEAVKAYGVSMGTFMCQRLLSAGAPGVHMYTLNLEKAAGESASERASERANCWPGRAGSAVRPGIERSVVVRALVCLRARVDRCSAAAAASAAAMQSPSWRTAASSSSSPPPPLPTASSQPTAMPDPPTPYPLAPALPPGLGRSGCMADRVQCAWLPDAGSTNESSPLPLRSPSSCLLCADLLLLPYSYSSYAHVLSPQLSSCNFCVRLNDCWPSDCALLLSHGVRLH